MSLIFGINLCDRVYISGDTRMSQRKDGVLVGKKDQIIKVAFFSKQVIGAFAGDAHMSAFVINRLENDLPKDLDIRSFAERAAEIIAPIANEYWENQNSSASIAIIFGGINPHKKKAFDSKDIYNRVVAYTKARGQGGSFNMKPALFNNMMTSTGKPPRYPEPSDNYVFSVQVFPPNGFVVTGAEWGEYLAYGPNGLTKDHVDPLIFGMIEFDAGSVGKDNAAIAAVLGSLVEERKEETISGTFFNGVIADEGPGAVLGGISRINLSNMKEEFISEIIRTGQEFYSRQKDGSLLKLTFIRDYKDFGSLDLL